MKMVFLYLMAAFYIGAGINHFLHPAFYEKIMPPYLIAHSLLIVLSGALETLAGVLLLIAKTRRLGAFLIILLLVAIFPANIQMAINFWQSKDTHLWIALLRLPLQFILIWWAWIYSKK